MPDDRGSGAVREGRRGFARLRRLRRPRGWVLCASLAVLASAAVGVHSAVPPPGPGTTPRADGPAVRPTTAEADLLHRAEQLLVRDCMRRAGFRYWPTPPRPGSGYRDFPYGIDDPAWAARHGYGRDVVRLLDRAEAASPQRRYLDGIGEQRRRAYGTALNGPAPQGLSMTGPLGGTLTRSDQGCVTESWRRLYGDAQEFFRGNETLRQLQSLRTGRVLADPNYLAAAKRWSACVAGSGQTAPNPSALRAGRLALDEPDAEARDVAAATAEARCARSTGLATTARAVERARTAELEARYGPDLRRLWGLQASALPRARDVVARDVDDVR
ncbi:hypothetical protein ABT160_40085 [Streptomyces sp. NPDC001941]|uniref:hypothetical protein n=1 Tax=Streptomyces sp. NPDC001941 TaxID=3154659 RepID=UPI0033167922